MTPTVPGTMRSAVMRSGRFTVEESPTPRPGPGEVLVKTRACGICGSDLHFFRHADDLVAMTERMGAQAQADALRESLKCGLVLGHEFVGEVAAFGPETARALKAGDHVVSMPFVLKPEGPALLGSTPQTPGAYGEYMVLSEALLLKTPDALPDEAAALVEPLGIAIHAVNRADLKPGDAVAVVGCGPIGLAILAVLKARGLETIVAADFSPRRRELALAMGAGEAVDPTAQSAIARAAELAPAAPMVVFENTGAPGVLGQVVVQAPAKARVVVVGIAMQEESFLPMLAITKELRLDFVIYYSPEEFAEALEMMASGVFDWRALVTGKVGVDGVGAAFDALRDPEVHAKILIEPWRNGGLSA